MKIPALSSLAALSLLLLPTASLRATPTENYGIRTLPAPGTVKIDGNADDWDLSGGVFACDNVEEGRDQYAVWLHTMYDSENLYILAHFIDPTPYNNPGQPGADYGFQGDCLQFRTLTRQGTPQERGNHFTAWRGRDGTDVVQVQLGRRFKDGEIADAKKTNGVKQAFAADKDGKGYNQELAIPWKLLTSDGAPLKAGEAFTLTFEPNFTVGKTGRLTVKDVFKPGVQLDRVFTFQSYTCWGVATLEPKGNVTPKPVRLADTRQFPVSLVNGKLSVDWKGLISEKVLPGFKTIRFTTPEDGIVSLNIKNAEGKVVCQLLRGFPYGKGEHEVQWDGLTTPNGDQPGDLLPAGEYQWNAIFHKGIGVRLRGWASNAGTPWDNGSATNWGGDEGNPTNCAAGNGQMYLSWSCAEAGRALVVTDLQGNVRWKNNRAGIAGVKAIAEDAGIVYVLGGSAGPMADGGNIYTLDAKTGDYIMGADGTPDIVVKALWPNPEGKSATADGIAAKDGLVYLSFAKDNAIMVVDEKTRKLLRTLEVPEPGALAIQGKMLYALSAGSKVLSLAASGEAKPMVEGLSGAFALTVDPKGLIYVGEREPDQQVKIYGADGKLLRTLGRKGGRPLLGAWVADGFRSIAGLAVDGEGKLWVAENDAFPKRVSIWNAESGKLTKEFFGPTHYGASGGAINPVDPNVMVGEGCEWQMDPVSGRAVCAGVFEREEANFSKFCQANGRLYLATLWSAHGSSISSLSIYERLGAGEYKLRSKITTDRKAKTSQFWADENGDGQEQPQEIQNLPQDLTLGGYLLWSIHLNSDLTLTAGAEVKLAGFTPCGAPRYDVANLRPLPSPGVPSLDGRLLLSAARMGMGPHNTFDCYDAKTGAMLWTYPLVFGGVHGSHNAGPPETGLIRGAFGIVGAARFPAPVGDVWAINTNVSEWHLITGDGFYLARLFEPDFLKYQWPEAAVPGASMDKCPPGMGGEDFGGSMVQGKDGKMYIQSGKVALWNLEVVGVDTVRALAKGAVALSSADTKLAFAQHEAQMQAASGAKSVNIRSLTPAMTGNFAKDFADAEILTYKKGEETLTHSALAWDAQNLYVGFEVKDATAWVNGANEPAMMYLSGDTVDLQLGTDPKANAKRGEPVLGDLRLSIGSVKGEPKAVIYRKVAQEKHPRVFSSGVVKEYPMESVVEVPGAAIKVNKRNGSYVVEAAIPFAALGLTPAKGLTLRGDMGVTFGDPAGQRTRLRSYWSNQHTGLVDDAVFELKMEPQHWGDMTFQ